MAIRILFQGDSITDCGRSRDNEDAMLPNHGLGESYAQLVAARLLCDHPELQLQFFNRGISGNRIVDLYARWKRDAIALKPDVISILIGVNDTWHEGMALPNGVEPERAQMVYRNLLEWTRQALPNTKLVLLQPYVLPFGVVQEHWISEVAARGEYTAKLAQEFQAEYIPLQQLLNDACQRAPQEHWLRDGVHPVQAGHQLFADAWIKKMLPIIKSLAL